MSYKFLSHSLTPGRYEPEGIYLTLPLPGECHVTQAWGEQQAYYGTFRYNGVPLKGHNGIDFHVRALLPVIAVDDGRVMEIGREPAGYERYLKVEHLWGESLYANLGQIHVEAGQIVKRATELATTEFSTLPNRGAGQSYLHFGIRIRPYNRFDGWGGFTDPTPYLDPTQLIFATTELGSQEDPTLTPHPMMIERERSRRP